MNKEITAIISSRKTTDECEDFINQMKETCGAPLKIVFVTNENTIGLAELYAGMMENKNIESNVLVFCHDDIEFLKPGWGKELLRLFNEHKDYGIIGVAGSAQFDEKGAWWNYKEKYGQVLHKHDGKSWLTAFSPLLDHDLQEVCVIDGLFIGVERTRVTKNFDKDIKFFHMYDIDFCLANYIDGKTKIGVTTNIRLAHHSVGALSDQWFRNLEQVNEKYGKYYPIKVGK